MPVSRSPTIAPKILLLAEESSAKQTSYDLAPPYLPQPPRLATYLSFIIPTRPLHIRYFPIRRVLKRVLGRIHRWLTIPHRAQAKLFQKVIRARCLVSRSSARFFPARSVCDEQVSAQVSFIGMGVAFSSRTAGYVGLGGIWIR